MDERLVAIRQALADYKYSEGCTCCQNIEEHKHNDKLLAFLLGVPQYEDGSGYDWAQFRSKRER